MRMIARFVALTRDGLARSGNHQRLADQAPPAIYHQGFNERFDEPSPQGQVRQLLYADEVGKSSYPEGYCPPQTSQVMKPLRVSELNAQ